MVRLESGRYVEASLRGRLKHTAVEIGQVVVGDSVEVVNTRGSWTIDRVAERSSLLVRRGRGGTRGKLVAANIETAFAVVAVRRPSATPELADRLLVLAEACRLRPVLVINKIDLDGTDALADRLFALYAGVGYRVLKVSARTGSGTGELRREMANTLSTLMGPSGVGKSSLLNAVDPGAGRRTAPVSRIGSGRQTTVSARIVALATGGFVADTPGFTNVQTWGVAPAELVSCFPELDRAGAGCQFRNCAHTSEPGCAVRTAVHHGSVPTSRYESYLKARQEAAVAMDERVAAAR